MFGEIAIQKIMGFHEDKIGNMVDEKRPLLTHTAPELWEKLKPLARQMRHVPTPAEDRLWQHIRNRQLKGMKFRRQWAIERFIVDFFCYEANLIIEVDGSKYS